MAQRPQLKIINYRKGMYVVVEGTRDTGNFYIIQSGHIQLSRNGEVVRPEGGTTDALNPGDFFAVVSAMSQHNQIETAQAITDVTLIQVARSQFEGLIQFNTPVAMKIIQQFSRRIRLLNDELTHVTKADSTSEGSSVLFQIGEYYRAHQKGEIALYAYKRCASCYPNSDSAAAAKQYATELAQFDKPNFEVGNAPFIRTYPKDSPVFAEGEPGAELYIIQSGTVKIVKITDNNEVILAILKQGDIFGEMALLEAKPRSASAIAYDGATLMVVGKKNFESMSATQPQIISKLTQLLADRIWFSFKQLENAKMTDPVGRCYDYMLIQLEKARFQIQEDVAYSFNFGPNELLKMAGIPDKEARKVTSAIFSNKKITLSEGKIFVTDTMELLKLSDYYKKMQQRTLGKK